LVYCFCLFQHEHFTEKRNRANYGKKIEALGDPVEKLEDVPL